jgi:DNA modification methylase
MNSVDSKVVNQWAGITSGDVRWSIYASDAVTALKLLPSDSIDCVVTSPPYFWLRDYGVIGQIGQEEKVENYVNNIANVMDQVRRVLKRTGVLFLNIGDTYYSGKGESQGIDPKSTRRRFGLRAVDKSGGLGIGLKPKTIIGVPWRVGIEMMKRSWTLRSPIIWYRKNALPEAVRDRPRRSYENVFMFVKDRKYYFNRDILADSEQEDMWTIVARPKPTNGLDTAPFPDELVERCLALGCPSGGTVMDPFAGSGTTLRVALKSGRPAIGIDVNKEFCQYMVGKLNEL